MHSWVHRVGSSSESVSCLGRRRITTLRPSTVQRSTVEWSLLRRARRCRRATAFDVSANTRQRRSSPRRHGEVVRRVVHVHHHVQVGLERLVAREREREHARRRVVPVGLVELEAVPADVRHAAAVRPPGEERRAGAGSRGGGAARSSA